MINFTAKSDLNLAVALTIDMSTAATVTTSPIARNLGNLATMTALKTRLFWSAPAFNGDATVSVKAGDTLVKQFELTAGGDSSIDLSAVGGGADITIQAACTTTGSNFLLSAWLEIEHPVILGA